MNENSIHSNFRNFDIATAILLVNFDEFFSVDGISQMCEKMSKFVENFGKKYGIQIFIKNA